MFLVLHFFYCVFIKKWIDSDIDLVIATAEDISATDGLLLLAELVRGKVWSERVVEVLDARVPIIKISTKREFGTILFLSSCCCSIYFFWLTIGLVLRVIEVRCRDQ